MIGFENSETLRNRKYRKIKRSVNRFSPFQNMNYSKRHTERFLYFFLNNIRLWLCEKQVWVEQRSVHMLLQKRCIKAWWCVTVSATFKCGFKKEETLLSVHVVFFKFTCFGESQVLSWKPSQCEQETIHVQVSIWRCSLVLCSGSSALLGILIKIQLLDVNLLSFLAWFCFAQQTEHTGITKRDFTL